LLELGRRFTPLNNATIKYLSVLKTVLFNGVNAEKKDK